MRHFTTFDLSANPRYPDLMDRKVALIVESSSGYGRGIFSGIIRFMRIHNDWSVFLEQRDIHRKPPDWLSNWNGDGIISRTTTPELAQAVRTNKIPFVELTDRFEVNLSTPTVRSDDLVIGKLAAEHLLERGFERFGFCGFEGETWSERRESGFRKTIEASGKTVVTFSSPWRGARNHSWEQEQNLIANWLEKIPRPFGVMACNDVRGKHVLDAAMEKRLAVPEEIAVVGVDDDELLCQVCSPPLSSVIPNASSVGYRAAELLSELMRAPANNQFHEPNLVAPLGIATRQSSDVVAIEDPEVAAALAFIRKNACYRKINVEDILRNVAVSRTSLERKLRKYIGRSPQQEIRHVQIKKVKQLLIATDFSAERIAKLCGFDYSEYMHVVFKRVTGQTVGEFRKQTAN